MPRGVVYFQSAMLSALLIVYQKGDIVKDPMKSIPFLPQIVPGVGWGRVGWGGVGHARVGGWGGSCKGGVG